MSAPRPPIVLTVAGSDPGGGAGVQADLATFSALETLGVSAVTALTVQSPKGVRAVHPVQAELVLAQLECLLEDLPAGALRAVKLGMLGSVETVEVIGARLRAGDVRDLPVVLDPVVRASHGASLLEDGGLDALRAGLLRRVDVLTPNLDEAAALLGRTVGEVMTAPEAALRDLAALGPRAVVLKGGHAGGRNSEDLLWCDDALTRLSTERIMTDNDHGTGCAFSSALAAYLARGEDLLTAARGAKEFVTGALFAARGWDFAGGAGPLHLAHPHWGADPDGD